MKRSLILSLFTLGFLAFITSCSDVNNDIIDAESAELTSNNIDGALSIQEGVDLTNFEVDQLASEMTSDYVVSEIDGNYYAHPAGVDMKAMHEVLKTNKATTRSTSDCTGSYSSYTQGSYPGGRYHVPFFNRNCDINSYFVTWQLYGDYQNGDVSFGYGVSNSTKSWCSISWPTGVNLTQARATMWWTYPHFIAVASTPLYNL